MTLFRFVSAIALVLLPSIAVAQSSIPGKSIAAPAGFLPSTAIYCDDGTGHAVMCSFASGGGGGGGTGDASAANQTTQIARETSIRDQIGALSAPATGSTNYWLGSVHARLGTPFQAGASIGNSAFGARLQDGSGSAFGTSANPLYMTTSTSSAGVHGAAAPAYSTAIGARTSAANLVAPCVSTAGAWCAPVAGLSQSTGTVTAVAASTSTTVCPATTNPVTYEVQIYGAGPVLLGLDGQTLTAITPAAGSGAYMLLPTQYALYVGPVARTNVVTAWTATAQTVVCNIVTRS